MPTRHRAEPLLTGLATVALVVVLAACGTTTPTTAPTTAPVVTLAPSVAPATVEPTTASASGSASASAAAQATTGHIQLPDKGFGLTLPDGWESLPVDPAALAAVIESLPEGSDMRGLLEGQMGSSALQAIAFWAFDFRPETSATGSTRNMNVIVQPASTFDLELVASSVKAQLGTIDGIGTIESEVVDLPAGKALRLDYDLDIAGAGGAQTPVATTQYYVQLPSATLIISFSADKATSADAAGDFEAIIQSLEAVS